MAKSTQPTRSSKAAKSERQRLIDETMKKQKGADKKRSFAIVGVCILIAVILVGAAAYRPVRNSIELRQYAGTELSSIGGPASSCQKVETKKATGVSDHVPTGQEVTYDVAPPAYGPHWNELNVAPAPFDDKFYDADDRPELESLVHNLEHGYTILWYDETIADDASAVSEIQGMATKFQADDQNFRLKFIAAPWLPSDEGGKSFPDGQHVAMTHWQGDAEQSTGVWQYCSEPSGAALQTFMKDYPFTDAPEANAI